MENIKKALENLSVIDEIYTAFEKNGLEKTDENLKCAGFGFHKITESLGATVVLTDPVDQFVDRIRQVQQDENAEQPFVLLGRLGAGDNSGLLILFDEFIEDNVSNKKEYSASYDKHLMNGINQLLGLTDIANKVVLLGHTHPIVSTDGAALPEDKSAVASALFGLEGNPLKLRKTGLNISVADVGQLIHAQEQAGREVLVLQGIVLQNGEFNIIFWDGDSLRTLDNVYGLRDEELSPRKNFRGDSSELGLNKF